MANNYNFFNSYGYDETNPIIVKSNVRGIEDKTIYGGLYTVLEETRDWREKIQQHVTNEHEDTREIVNNWTTDETNRAIDSIDTHVTNEVTDAEVLINNKIDTKGNSILNSVGNVQTTVNEIKSNQATINSRLQSLENQYNSLKGGF